MVFCQNCGANVAGRFCGSCGSSVGADPGASGSAVAAASTPLPPAPSAPPPPRPAGAAASAASLVTPTPAGYVAVAEPSGIGAKVKTWDESHLAVIDGLKRVYSQKIRPTEAAYKFDHFFSPLLNDADFDAKPMVLLMGQYSVGKTSFIKFLLERDFPGQRIGPEPTTDRFVAVMHGPEERIIPGNALAVQADMPFRALQKHGMAFLNKFEASICPAPILEKITFIDTPGVLSGEKQRLGRQYDFPDVIEWFAERADRIILLFDAHKLDISDELKRAIQSLRGHDDKIRVILNKADMINNQQLMRVYGALMWSLGKVVTTPEALRVYVGSFIDREYQIKDNKALFEVEQNDLLADLRSLPRNASVRKINELVKRARCAKVHALIIQHMYEQFGFFSKQSTQDEMLGKLPDIFLAVHQKTGLPIGDFPNPQRFREGIQHFKIWEFPELKPKQVAVMDDVLANDIPKLLRMLPTQHEKGKDVGGASSVLNPFDEVHAGVGQAWVISGADKSRFDNIFFALPLEGDKVRGSDARTVFMATGVSVESLKKIWSLADISKRGLLDAEEFAVAMFLIESLRDGKLTELPARLPESYVPPAKRHLVLSALHQ